jgi:type II secretory pathway pseudopilin PulG
MTRPQDRRQRQVRPRGFWLIELLVLLGMLGLIALAGGRLFETTMRLGRSSADAANAAASFDAMSSTLRRDAWSAAEMAVEGNGAVAKLKSGDAVVVWTIGQDGSIARDDGRGGPRAWSASAGSTFALDGPSLVLRLPETKAFRAGEVRATSQVHLLTGRAP